MYIVATISINSYTADKIEEIIRAGAEVLRYNFSHGTPEEMTEKVNVAKEVINRLNVTEKVKILADLPGSKIRLGDIPVPGKVLPVTCGEVFTFKTGATTPDPCQFIPVNHPSIGAMVRKGDIFTLADGEIGFEVLENIDHDTFRARVLNTSRIPALKACNITKGIDELNHLTEKTIAHINNLPSINPDWVAFSFVNSTNYLKRAKDLLKPLITDDWQPRIVSKIETPQGIERTDEIAKESDIVLVARGDMGLMCPIELIGIYQKQIIRAAKAANKEVIVSTQILESVVSSYVPGRSDVLDLTNIILDGADGIMLARETGVSPTPGHSVEVARRIINAVEDQISRHAI